MGDEPPIPSRQRTPEAHLPGPFERHPFTPEQARHVALMRAIAQELTSRTGDAFVLKGGTALLLVNILLVSCVVSLFLVGIW